MKNLFVVTLLLTFFIHSEVLAQDEERDVAPADRERPVAEVSQSPNEESPIHTALLYIPNRVFDFLDIFRLRARVGPGVHANVRATEALRLGVGGYSSLYVGAPGPRLGATFPLPAGIENHAGLEVSFVEMSSDMGSGPAYSSTEIGVGAQLVVLGVDVGFDPMEIADFIAGIFTFDLREDDL
jgi:hypothetical protein